MGRDDRRRDGESGRRRRGQRDAGPRLKRVEREDRPGGRQRSSEERAGAREGRRGEQSEARESTRQAAGRGQGGRHRADSGRRESESSMIWLWVVIGLIVVGVIVWFLFF